MIWTLDNCWVRVQGTDEERSWLYGYLVFRARAFKPEGSNTKKVKFFEQTHHLYDLQQDRFPAGLARRTFKRAKEEGLTVEIRDVRAKPVEPNRTADLEWLRHHPYANIEPIVHEIDAVEAVWKSPRGVLKLPTGSGKGDIACGLTRSIVCTWLFLVHRSSLVKQQAERFLAKTGEAAGVIGDGQFDIKRVTCATFQSIAQGLARRDKRIEQLVGTVQGVMVDECHSLGGEENYGVVMKCRAAHYRVGLTATPKRGDGRSVFMTAALGDIVYTVEARYLRDIGILSWPDITFLVSRQKGSDAVTWQGAHGDGLIRNRDRNRLLLSTTIKAAKPCLAFVKQLTHGKRLKEALEKKGIRAEFMWGGKNPRARSAAIERGDTEVIVCNVIFQEGVDIPSLRSVVIGTGGASPIASIQRLGRGTRRADGKNTFEVWDFADLGCGCEGDADMAVHKACRWLEAHFKKRRSAYLSEGFECRVVDMAQLELTAQDSQA